jgi:metal-dependent amidase/aminoacylase/carboxypeptidase family protein
MLVEAFTKLMRLVSKTMSFIRLLFLSFINNNHAKSHDSHTMIAVVALRGMRGVK